MIDKQTTEDPLYKLLCRHFVALHVEIARVDGTLWTPLRSGFLLELEGTYFWISAGHAVKRLLEPLDRGCTFKRAFLSDLGMTPHFVPPEFGNAEPSTQFDFLRAPKFYIDEDGIDVAAIELNDLYSAMLLANGAEAIQISHVGLTEWQANPYFILGAPEEFTETFTDDGLPAIQFVPVMWRLKRLPDEIKDGVMRLRFDVGANQITSGGKLQESMEGMSGGPIFGLKLDKDGKQRYYAVAIQSSWLPKSKIAFGCPLDRFAGFLHGLVTNSIEELREQG